MFIKSIQYIISDKEEEGKIDLLNKKYYKKIYDDKQLDEIFSYFSNLKNLNNYELDAIRNLDEDTDAIRQMGDILKLHPITKMIYTENNFLKIKKAPTLQRLLNEVINKIDIKELEMNEDVIGEIYEHIINGYVKKGSKLGQYFTPRKLMKLLLEYKKDNLLDIISKIGKKDKIKLYDSCMGTGGWIVTGYNMLKDKYINRMLLSGGDVKPSTFKYGLMNLILTLKHFPYDVRCESSLTHINNTKHNFVFTNPPFQTDKKFDQVKENFNNDKYTETNKIKINEVYELKDNSPPIQFLELDLYKLEDNGLCIIILPYGELFFGTSYAEFRKHFMKETKITDIILFEGGVFTHTGIKTCALIFEKNNKGTNAINFIQANKDCNKLIKITTITIDDINKEPCASWNLRDYLKDEYIENLSNKMTNFEWVNMKDIFTLEKGKLQSSKVEEDDTGEAVFVNLSKTGEFIKIGTNSLDNENVFISNTAPLGLIQYYNGKCEYSDLLHHFVLKDKYKNKISIKYIYYFLQSISEHIGKVYDKGSCNKLLDQKNINRMKIPIPTLEEQDQIIQNVMILEECITKINQALDNNKKLRNMYMESMIKNSTEKDINKILKLWNVCDINNGKNITEAQFVEGEFNVIGGGRTYIGNHNEFNVVENSITIAKDGNTCGTVLLHKNKIFVSNHGLYIDNIKEDIVLKSYLYNYLLLIEKILSSYGKGSAQPGIHKDDILGKIKIPVPSIEYQKIMEKTLNNIDETDNNLINMLNQNKESIKSAMLNSLDNFGNPTTFNVYNEVLNSLKDSDTEDTNVKTEAEKPKKKIFKKKKPANSNEITA